MEGEGEDVQVSTETKKLLYHGNGPLRKRDN